MPIDYSNALIYKIICNDVNIKDCYVGSTIDFTKRKYNHKSNCNNENSKLYHYKSYNCIRENGGWDNWTMVLVEKYPCENFQELLKREKHWIETLNANLNTLTNYGRGQEDIKLYNKQRLREYYLANIEQLKTKLCAKCICECGSKYIHCHKARHERTLKHQNFKNFNNA